MIHRFADCELDEALYQLRRNGAPVALEPKVFDLLAYLIEHHDRVVSKDELLDKLWPGQVVSETALTQCVMAARKAVGDDGNRQHTIKTQHGRGYRFVGRVVSSQHPVDSNEEEISSQHPVASTPSPLPQEPGLTTPRSPGSWFRHGFVSATVLLLIGSALTVHYLSRPTPSTQSSVLVTEKAKPPLPLPDKPSIIVLPFVNLSGDPTQEYFSDGMTEEITATLSRVAGLFVIARTSAFTYKGKAVKVQSISHEMGVHYVLEGSVQKADGHVRIIVQLIDAITGNHLWSEHYDRPLQNIFALQDEIREKIVLALKVRLAPDEQAQVRQLPTTNLEAYDLYLRGREAFWRAMYKNDPLVPARQLYERALVLDSQYAEAYAQIAGTYLADWFFEPSRNQGQSLERALTMAQQAIALNDALPLPHAILGSVSVWKRQYGQALAAAQRAVTLDPNFAEGYFHLGTVLFSVGPPDESVKAHEQAIRLDPKHPDYYLFQLAASYRIAGRYQEALALGKQFAARYPDFSPIHLHLAVCYAELDQLEEARAEGAEMLRLSPAFGLTGFERYWPMKDPAVVKRTLAALRKAGLK